MKSEMMLPKVQRYVEATEALQHFKEQHSDVFQQLTELLQEHNDSLEDAEKEVRSRGVACGPFLISGEAQYIDDEKLLQLLGNEKFLEIGGKIGSKRVVEIDREKFKDALHKLPKHVVDACVKKVVKFKVPAKAELP